MLIISTFQGLRKTSPAKIFSIFLKYLMNLIEEKSGEKVTELNLFAYREICGRTIEIKENPITKEAAEMLNIQINI